MAETTSIDDRQFKFDISIGSGISLTKSSIKYLEIDSRLPETGFVEGVMVVDNTLGALDDVINLGGDPFTDLLYIYIQAMDGEGEVPTPPLEHVCSIYEVNDLPVGDYPRSAKRIKFREVGYQAIRTIKNTVSLEDFDEFEEDSSNLSNNERSIRTDIYLKKIFTKAGLRVSKREWAKGRNYIPLISPFANEYLYDTIKKIHPRHIWKSKPHDYIYVYWDAKAKEMKSYSLSKLMVEKSKRPEWILESFILGSVGRYEDGGGGSKVVARGASSDLSVIKSLNFSYPTAEELGRKLSSFIPVVETRNDTRYDTGGKALQKAWGDYKEFYAAPLKNSGPPSTYLNDKFKYHIIETGDTSFSTMQNITHANLVNTNAHLMYTALINSKKVNFTCRGMPFRQSGKFADIGTLENIATPKHEKFCGRYWVHNCKHIFSDDKYWNDITMISP